MSLGITTAQLAAAIGVLSGAMGVVSGIVMARYMLRKDSREDVQTGLDKAEADDKASDRVLKLLTAANELALKNERLQYEIKLNEEITKLKALHKKQLDEMRTSLIAEMSRQIREALDVYGCENAATGCENRKPRAYAAQTDVSPGGTD